jgi:hypothetical protein
MNKGATNGAYAISLELIINRFGVVNRERHCVNAIT